jgi:uncharacterized protein (UPF0332 family)
MTKEQNDYINYRLQRATDTLNDAKLLAENGRWNSSINRLYYACFYAVSALLYFYSIEAKTHKGVRIKFMSEFIKTGLFDKDFGKLFSDLFDWRQEGDYSDFVSFDKDLTIPLIIKSEEFVNLIRAFLQSNELLINRTSSNT